MILRLCRCFSRSAAALICPLVVTVLAAQAYSQTSADVNRAQSVVDQMPTAAGPVVTTTGTDDQGHVVTSPNDPDLGEQQILKRTESYQAFSASIGAPFYWTSNVALTNSGEQSDFLVSPVAAVGYSPRLGKNLSMYADVREQLFYYDRLTSFDFGSFDAEIGLLYTVPQLHNLTLHFGYDYNRLTKKDSFESFFQNHVLVFSAEVPFSLSRAQQIAVGVDTNVSLVADPEPPRRQDFEVYVGYSLQLTRALVLSASARAILHDYVQTDRLDVSEVIALSASYAVTKYLSASAIANFAANQSNHSVFDYQVGNAGGAVSLVFHF